MAMTLMRQIAVLFMMMGCGWLLVRYALLRSEDSRALSVVLIYIVQPCVVVRAFQIDFTAQVRRGFLLALAAAVLIHLLLLLFNALLKRGAGLSAIERASILYSNAGNLVIPLVTAMMGEEWVIYASAFLCVQLVFMWTYGVSMIRGERSPAWRRILLNSNLIAIALGLALMLLRIRLPGVVMSAMEGLSATIGPLSMIMIGMLFAGQSLRTLAANRRLWAVCAVKMLLAPALVLAFLAVSRLASLADDGRTVLYISFLAVMTPSASMVTQLAQLYDRQPEYAGAINVFTTLVCIGTMPLMTWLYNLVIG